MNYKIYKRYNQKFDGSYNFVDVYFSIFEL